MDMSDDKESDERDQISKNDEEIVTDDIEVLKLRKLISQKKYGQYWEKSDKSDHIDTIDYK